MFFCVWLIFGRFLLQILVEQTGVLVLVLSLIPGPFCKESRASRQLSIGLSCIKKLSGENINILLLLINLLILQIIIQDADGMIL